MLPITTPQLIAFRHGGSAPNQKSCRPLTHMAMKISARISSKEGGEIRKIQLFFLHSTHYTHVNIGTRGRVKGNSANKTNVGFVFL